MAPVARVHGVTPRGRAQVSRSPLLEGRFGRMFRKLPPAPEYSVDELLPLAESMREQDAVGGWNQPGAPDPIGDNPDIPSAYTYFGQFVDHDITFDATSRLQVRNDPDALIDFRTPRYDLDSLYGSGPVDEPFQYDKDSPGRMLLPVNVNGVEDLPRNSQGTALIGDPRNDENVIVSGLQIILLRLHNKLAAEVDQDPAVPAETRFDETRRRVLWHYQWVIVHDYLPRICDQKLVEGCCRSRTVGPGGASASTRRSRTPICRSSSRRRRSASATRRSAPPTSSTTRSASSRCSCRVPRRRPTPTSVAGPRCSPAGRSDGRTSSRSPAPTRSPRG